MSLDKQTYSNDLAGDIASHGYVQTLARVGVANNDATVGISKYERVTNRISSRRHTTERLLAAVLMGAGALAWMAGWLGGSALFWVVGVILYLHSRLIALWSDEP